MTRALLLLLSLFLASCSVNPVTGARQLNFYSESSEISMGAEADGQIVQQYGLLKDEAVSQYVGGIGNRMVPVSHRPNLPFHFRVLDDPVVNAFALPGGFVYITRGILTYLNSEAALAGVVGHEIGHVTAQHGVTRASKQSLFGIGLAIGSQLTSKMPIIGQVSSAASQLLLLKYSRDDERQADELGVQYATAIGYDTHDMASFFGTLARLSAGKGGLPGWMSTHPDPGDRFNTVNRLTEERWAAVPAEHVRHIDEFLDAVDGLAFGVDPREGFFRDNVFHHPGLAFRFPIPAGWQGQNTQSTVAAIEPDQKAVLMLGMVEADSPEAAATAWSTAQGVVRDRYERVTMGGQPAWRTRVQITQDGNTIVVVSTFFRWGDSNAVWVMHGYAARADFNQYARALESSMAGWTRETDPAILNIQPIRLRVVKAKTTASFADFARSWPVPEEAGIDGVNGLAILNGLDPRDTVKAGRRLKVLVKPGS